MQFLITRGNDMLYKHIHILNAINPREGPSCDISSLGNNDVSGLVVLTEERGWARWKSTYGKQCVKDVCERGVGGHVPVQGLH